MSRRNTLAVLTISAVLAVSPTGAALGGGVSADCTRAVEHYAEVQERLAKAVERDAPKRKIKRLKRKLRKADRRVERECG